MVKAKKFITIKYKIPEDKIFSFVLLSTVIEQAITSNAQIDFSEYKKFFDCIYNSEGFDDEKLVEFASTNHLKYEPYLKETLNWIEKNYVFVHRGAKNKDKKVKENKNRLDILNINFALNNFFSAFESHIKLKPIGLPLKTERSLIIKAYDQIKDSFNSHISISEYLANENLKELKETEGLQDSQIRILTGYLINKYVSKLQGADESKPETLGLVIKNRLDYNKKTKRK